MTISSNFATVAASIAALTFTGIRNVGIDKVPELMVNACPIFFPNVDSFITDFSANVDTFGTAGTEQMTLTYTLNYHYNHSKIGSDPLSVYQGFITAIALISQTIMTNDTLTGAANIRLQTIPMIGMIADPAGNLFWSCDFQVKVEEYT